MAIERVAAHLAVGDDVEPRLLLHRDGLVYGAILDRFAGGGRQLAAIETRVRVPEIVRTEKGADDIAVEIHSADRSASRPFGRCDNRTDLNDIRA